MSTFADLPYLLKLQLSWVSSQQFKEIAEHFSRLEYARDAQRKDWEVADILSDSQLEKIFSTEIEAEVEASLEWGDLPEQGWLLSCDDDFPSKLATLNDAPYLLGYKGNPSLLSDPQIAIVGSRHASKSGKEIAEDFAQFLSDQGLAITSGLALGIDAAAHQGGLKGVGKTVAVVATGLDRIYPATNKHLGQQIVEQGVMISEFPLGTKPINYNFPKRNRIISGLSLGTLVVEAALKSGSLITAKTAMEQGREVFAVPGSIHNPQAKGCHQLIQQGAKLVESGRDILEELAGLLQGELNFNPNSEATINTSNETTSNVSKEAGLLQWIEYDPISLDELVVLTKQPVSSLQSALLMLELSGAIESLSAGRWRRIK